MLWKKSDNGIAFVLFIIFFAFINYWVETLALATLVGLMFFLYKLIIWEPKEDASNDITKDAALLRRKLDEDLHKQKTKKLSLEESQKIHKDAVIVRSNWGKIDVKNISSFKEKLTRKDFIVSYVDENGYDRNYRNRLIHRVITYRFLYNNTFKNLFSTYQIHHKDHNKRNNHPNNLQILTKKEHDKIHGTL